MKISLVMSAALLAGTLTISPAALAQLGPPAAAPLGPPPPAEKAAPIDLTGYWVSVVTEDWRWRMLTPPHGDYASVPLSPAGKAVADMWTPAEDGSCKAYYAAGLMRMPTRLHITWAGPNILRIESDWGEQTRTLYFNRSDITASEPSPQGNSFATWQLPVAVNSAGVFGPARPPRPPPRGSGGDLKVVTTNLAPGWLRRNGVPYSSKTVLTEYLQTFTDPAGKQWFDVTTQVVDPEYLRAPFVTSSDFRREPDDSNWKPHPCKG